jgi:flagellar hook-associated protein 1 FlgK
MSIMMGIETAIRSLRTHTLAMNTAEHNIANMNNEWYSRQLANITSTAPYSQVGLAGQVGSGSKVGSFERIRFIPRQADKSGT